MTLLVEVQVYAVRVGSTGCVEQREHGTYTATAALALVLLFTCIQSLSIYLIKSSLSKFAGTRTKGYKPSEKSACWFIVRLS